MKMGEEGLLGVGVSLLVALKAGMAK